MTDQDPLISATMADSVSMHLQQFITKYRTNKARIDVEHYQKLAMMLRLRMTKVCMLIALIVMQTKM